MSRTGRWICHYQQPWPGASMPKRLRGMGHLAGRHAEQSSLGYTARSDEITLIDYWYCHRQAACGSQVTPSKATARPRYTQRHTIACSTSKPSPCGLWTSVSQLACPVCQFIWHTRTSSCSCNGAMSPGKQLAAISPREWPGQLATAADCTVASASFTSLW